MVAALGVLSRAAQLLNIGALQALLAGAKVALRVDPPATDPDTTIAGMTEATFVGYAQTTIVAWGDIGFDADGVAFMSSGVQDFTCSGTATPNVVLGGWVEIGVGPTQPWVSWQFENPQAVVKIGDALPLIVKVRADGKVEVQLLAEIV